MLNGLSQEVSELRPRKYAQLMFWLKWEKWDEAFGRIPPRLHGLVRKHLEAYAQAYPARGLPPGWNE